MRKLIVSDTLRSSRDIYYKHITPPSRKPLSQPQRYQQFFTQIADAASKVSIAPLAPPAVPLCDSAPALSSSSSPASANVLNFNIEFAPEPLNDSNSAPCSTDGIPGTPVAAQVTNPLVSPKTVIGATNDLIPSCSFEQSTREQCGLSDGLPGYVAVASVAQNISVSPDGLPGPVAVASLDPLP